MCITGVWVRPSGAGSPFSFADDWASRHDSAIVPYPGVVRL
jgi:hypothetical protein